MEMNWICNIDYFALNDKCVVVEYGRTYWSKILDALFSKLRLWTFFEIKIFSISYVQPK
jgi:hypothetical protein